MNSFCAGVWSVTKRLYGVKVPPHRLEPQFRLTTIVCAQDPKEAPARQVLLFGFLGSYHI